MSKGSYRTRDHNSFSSFIMFPSERSGFMLRPNRASEGGGLMFGGGGVTAPRLQEEFQLLDNIWRLHISLSKPAAASDELVRKDERNAQFGATSGVKSRSQRRARFPELSSRRGCSDPNKEPTETCSCESPSVSFHLRVK